MPKDLFYLEDMDAIMEVIPNYFEKIHELNERFPKFIERMGYRVYTEWCLSEAKNDPDSHSNYKGEAFNKWVNDQTLYYIKRKQEKGTITGDNTDEQWRISRLEIISAALNAAVEYFKKYNDLREIPVRPLTRIYPKKSLNLRQDLRRFLS